MIRSRTWKAAHLKGFNNAFLFSKLGHSRRLSQIASIQAPHLSSSNETAHVGHIQSKLTEKGIVKVCLGFTDNKSEYLERLIRNLHQYHGHGLPIDHSASRGWFWDVRPTNTTTKSESPSIAPPKVSSPQARSETREAFPWHTDCSYEEKPPRYFALQVLQHDRCNGGTTSVLQVDRIVKYLSPSTLASLSKPEFAIKVPPEFIKKSDETEIVGSILAINAQKSGTTSASLRFREDIISPLTDAASSALNEFSSVLHGPEIEAEIVQLTPELLPRGSVVLIDNRRWLHARNQVNDPERHLRRVRWDATPFPSMAELQPTHAIINA